MSQASAESVVEDFPPTRTVVHIDFPAGTTTVGQLRQVAQLLTSAKIEPAESVHVLSTTKQQITYTQLSQIVDLGKPVSGLQVLATLKAPKAELSLDDIAKAAQGRGESTGTSAVARVVVIIIVHGPVVIVCGPRGPVIVILDW